MPECAAIATTGEKAAMTLAEATSTELTPRMQVAAELDLGMRRNFSGEHRYARRAGLMCMFSF